MLSPDELTRYSRHLPLEGFGPEGQQKLAASHVLVVGLGGLGNPAALYLAAAGVGTLGIADFDLVETHNLQRQVLYDTDAVGRPKVAAAAARLRAKNPFIRVVEHPEGVTPDNALSLFSSYDVIVDGTDTFRSRYLNGDAAALSGKPLVHGSVLKFEGQVTFFDPAGGGPCYRCLHPKPPPPGAVPACGEAGVIGALCGVVGSLQALEAIKWIVGVGEVLRGRVLVLDGLSSRFHSFSLARDPGCPVCGENPSIRSPVSDPLQEECRNPDPQPGGLPLEVTVEEARDLLRKNPGGARILDVREPFEWAICGIPGAELLSLGNLPQRFPALATDKHWLVLCHHGQRSMAATQFLRAQGLGAVSSVEGGIEAWARRLDASMRRY
jgi:adenylyltransferase/sulfurtransferase